MPAASQAGGERGAGMGKGTERQREEREVRRKKRGGRLSRVTEQNTLQSQSPTFVNIIIAATCYCVTHTHTQTWCSSVSVELVWSCRTSVTQILRSSLAQLQSCSSTLTGIPSPSPSLGLRNIREALKARCSAVRTGALEACVCA